MSLKDDDDVVVGGTNSVKPTLLQRLKSFWNWLLGR